MKLVCHRGIYSTISSPLENTLDAFCTAWSTIGYTYCECDVVLTKDDHFIVHHDLNFTRLLHPSLHTHPFAHIPIADLTLPQIQSHIRLRNGLPPDTLVNVIECAQRLSLSNTSTPRKQIVLELKCAEQEHYSVYVDALLKLLTPERLPYIALVMSFDLKLLQRLSQASRILPIFYLTETFELTEKNLLHLEQQISSLDGVYLQYQPEWNYTALEPLVKNGFRIGIWNDATQPDGRETQTTLPPCIQFLNTDIHLEEIDIEHKQ